MVNLANTITIGRIALIPIFILVLYLPIKYSHIIAAAVFILISLTDAVDGYVARKRNEITAFGKFADPIADKLLVSAALIFLIGHGVEAWMAFVIIAREILIGGIRLVAAAKGKVIHASSLGKIKTVSQVIGISAVILDSYFAWWIMLIAVLFTVISGLEYVLEFSGLLKD
jgi:CDP-diacylglycerol--glycerol-3-phosphate 3-phosphatidyltransferase